METTFVVQDDAVILSRIILPEDFLESSIALTQEHDQTKVVLRGKDLKHVEKTKKSFDQALCVVNKMRAL
jgi:hypothetical protein